MRYKIAAAQIHTGNDPEANLLKIKRMTEEAEISGAKLIAFPENSDYIGYGLSAHASEVPGEITEFIGKAAKDNDIYILIGSITEKRSEGKPGNSSLFFSPEGKLIARYSKLHMFDVVLDEGLSYMESNKVQAGDEIALVDTRLGMFGLSICYDMRFAEIYRLQALNGAQVIFAPSNYTTNTGKDHWEAILRTRAIENTCYVVAPDQIGPEPKFTAYGKTMIIDPWGNVIARASDREEIIYAEIDIDYISDIRRQIPSLNNIRSDIYSLTSSRIKIYHEDQRQGI